MQRLQIEAAKKREAEENLNLHCATMKKAVGVAAKRLEA